MDSETSGGNFKLIKQGAEARLYVGTYLGKPAIVKERFNKTYRHPDLDDRLTKERIKNEVKGLIRAKYAGLRTPSVYMVHPRTNSIYMEFLEGYLTVNEHIRQIVKEVGSDEANSPLVQLGSEIGTAIAKLHDSGIIHGDLTTSNILVLPSHSDPLYLNSGGELQFNVSLIDFGLSHHDNSPEDKGVDLYVLERAVLSTHSNIEWFFGNILKTYLATCSTASSVLSKLEEIRLRGRKRTMVG